MKRSAFVTALTALLVVMAPLSGLAQAQSVDQPANVGSTPTASLLAAGLDGATGSTIGPDGALYVTEGNVGRISRVDPTSGRVTTFASGLPPAIFPGLGGAIDVAFIGHTAYALVTLVGSDWGGNSVVGIYRVDNAHHFTVIADIGAWAIANPPDPSIPIDTPTGVQFALQPYRGGFLVTDGHHNRVLWVTLAGRITELIRFENIVPTGLALRGDTVYMAEAGPIPHLPENGKIVSFNPQSPTAAEVASGARLLVDVEFGGNTLYALSQGFWASTDPGSPANPNTGSLVKANADGTFTVVVDGLNQPTSLEFIGNTGYVVNLAGEIWKIDNVFPAAHRTVRETVNWALPAGQCASLVGDVTGTGQRSETIDTVLKLDGSSQVFITDLVIGTAQGSDGQNYTFYYLNHSTWAAPASGSPVAIKMDDLFLMQSSAAPAQNRYALKVAFVWRWTYDPNTAAYWPPVDNFVQTYTAGDPINCDPI